LSKFSIKILIARAIENATYLRNSISATDVRGDYISDI